MTVEGVNARGEGRPQAQLWGHKPALAAVLLQDVGSKEGRQGDAR